LFFCGVRRYWTLWNARAKNLRWGAPDEGVRGYTNNVGLHKSQGTQNIFGATHFGGGQ